MYHGNYINFCERGRTEFINHYGMSNQSLMAQKINIVVRHLTADYMAPAILEDMLEVTTDVAEINNSSFILSHTIHKGKRMLFHMKVVLVCINDEGRPIRIPDTFKNILEKAQ